MDTNSNIPSKKQVISVEILHLDELGYGPQGMFTRRVWRESCMNHLLAGRGVFKKWQDSWIADAHNAESVANHDYKLIFADGSSEIKFDFAQNPCNLDFVGHVFEESVNLGFEYLINTNFKGASFKGSAIFLNAVFKDFVLFSDVKFENLANFENVSFLSYSYFTNTTFNSDGDFSNSKFIGDANFAFASFNNIARFSDVRFSSFADFESTEFNDKAWFFSTKFNGAARFFKSKFKNDCIFDAGFTINKNYTEFNGITNFENCIIDNVGHFEKTIFKNKIPSFLGVDISKTRLEFSGDEYFSKLDISEDAVKRLGLLKRLADEHGQTDQALNFNAMELRVKRLLPDAAWGFKSVTWLYEMVSDFGRSFMRPISAYVVLIVCSLILTLPFTNYSHDISPEDIANQALCLPKNNEAEKPLQLPYGRAAFEYAMFRAGGVMDLTDTGKQNNAVNCKLFGIPIEPGGMRAWGVFKSVTSLALLFLAALGLRNKYRIK